jgi:hypothetical protein
MELVVCNIGAEDHSRVGRALTTLGSSHGGRSSPPTERRAELCSLGASRVGHRQSRGLPPADFGIPGTKRVTAGGLSVARAAAGARGGLRQEHQGDGGGEYRSSRNRAAHWVRRRESGVLTADRGTLGRANLKY